MKKFNTATEFINNHISASGFASGEVIEFYGYTTIGDKGGAVWKALGTTGTASQDPLTYNLPKLSDASGNEFEIIKNQVIDLNALGGTSAAYVNIADAAGITYIQGLTTDAPPAYIRPADTTAVMIALSNPSVGQVAETAAFSTGNGGGATYDAITTGVTAGVDLPNGFDILQSTADPLISWKLRVVAGELIAAQWGVNEDGITDDTLAFQAVVDALPNGGKIKVSRKPLIGGVIVTAQRLIIEGTSLDSQIIAKNGSVGITFTDHWCAVMNLTLKSQGTKADGLNTRGILFQATPTPTSKGFSLFFNVNAEGFSGYAVKAENTIAFDWYKGYVKTSTTGLVLSDDAGGVTFGTTAFVKSVYFSSCDTGILADRLYRSEIASCIFEVCNYGIDANTCTLSVRRSYFESNITSGLRAVNSGIEDLWNYKNDPTGVDKFDITFTAAVAAIDRGYTQATENGQDYITKKFGVLTQFGSDPLLIESMGTTDNIGIKYGENSMALVRGENMFDPTAWIPETTSEMVGWDNLNKGYKISSALTGARGMRQTVTFDNTLTYVIDWNISVVSGVAANSWVVKVGADTITNGVPFTPTANGANIVKIYAVQAGVQEAYIAPITLSEVIQDTTQISKANDILTRYPARRGDLYAAAAPTSGQWAVGEIVWNSAPSAGGTMGWVCTTAGSGGGTAVFKTFGTISA
jgi:hypothetical protein